MTEHSQVQPTPVPSPPRISPMLQVGLLAIVGIFFILMAFFVLQAKDAPLILMADYWGLPLWLWIIFGFIAIIVIFVVGKGFTMSTGTAVLIVGLVSIYMLFSGVRGTGAADLRSALFTPMALGGVGAFLMMLPIPMAKVVGLGVLGFTILNMKYEWFML